jgi:hypothetical protein
VCVLAARWRCQCDDVQRAHALSGITDKFRAFFKPDKVGCFTLALFMVRAWIKREATRADVEAFVETMELEEKQDAPALNVDGMHAVTPTSQHARLRQITSSLYLCQAGQPLSLPRAHLEGEVG